jgi:outer membrane lipoprotein-sorting protein
MEVAMRTGLKLLSAGCFIFSLLFAGLAFAEDFSANIVQTTQKGTYNGKIFAAKDKVRLETMDGIMIGRTDTRKILMIMPNQKSYMEVPFDTSHILSAGGTLSNEVERHLLGSETINGKETEKYHVVFEMLGNKNGVFQWVDKATMEPVKTQSQDGSWTIEYSNLVKGPQPNSLFEAPEGYQKLEAPALPQDASPMNSLY